VFCDIYFLLVVFTHPVLFIYGCLLCTDEWLCLLYSDRYTFDSTHSFCNDILLVQDASFTCSSSQGSHINTMDTAPEGPLCTLRSSLKIVPGLRGLDIVVRGDCDTHLLYDVCAVFVTTAPVSLYFRLYVKGRAIGTTQGPSAASECFFSDYGYVFVSFFFFQNVRFAPDGDISQCIFVQRVYDGEINGVYSLTLSLTRD